MKASVRIAGRNEVAGLLRNAAGWLANGEPKDVVIARLEAEARTREIIGSLPKTSGRIRAAAQELQANGNLP